MDHHKPWHSEESVAQYYSLFPLLPNFIAQSIVGIPGLRVGLESNQEYELTRKLLAALISHKLDVGLSYAEKRYVNDSLQSQWLGLTDRINSIFSYGYERMRYYVSFCADVPKAENSLQHFSVQFFFRNLIAFDAAKRLSDFGLLCETATILRAALEQFAFCAKLWVSPADTELRKLRAIEAINSFKEIVPSAGKLYGVLSTYTHFEYDHHTHFFEWSEEKSFTLQRSPILRGYATHLIFVMMACLAAYILRIAPTQFVKVPVSVAELETFQEMIDAYSDDVCKMLPTDEVLANFDMLLHDILTQNGRA